MREYEAALQRYTQALTIRQAVLEPNHPSIAACYCHIAAVYGRDGEYQMASECYSTALSIYRSTLDETHADVVRTKNNLFAASWRRMRLICLQPFVISCLILVFLLLTEHSTPIYAMLCSIVLCCYAIGLCWPQFAVHVLFWLRRPFSMPQYPPV